MSAMPQVEYAELTDEDIARLGLDAAERHFAGLLGEGLLSGPDLHVRLGTIEDNTFTQWGERFLGGNIREDLAFNTSADEGKISTVTLYGMDTLVASQVHGDRLPAGPKSWTGGVHRIAPIQIRGEWHEYTFAGASSGVQGVFDASVTEAGLTVMAAAWTLREKARRAGVE